MNEEEAKALALRLAALETMIALLFAKESARSGQDLAIMHTALVKNLEAGAANVSGSEDWSERAAQLVDGVFGLAALYLQNPPEGTAET
jgi:hypothetical protein